MRAVKFDHSSEKTGAKGKRIPEEKKTKRTKSTLGDHWMCASSSKRREKREGGEAPRKDGNHLEAGPGALKARVKAVRRFYQGLIGARAKRLEPKKGKTRRIPNEQKKKRKKCTVVCQGFLHQTEVGRVKDAV